MYFSKALVLESFTMHIKKLAKILMLIIKP
jgi:hypothetical protein